MTPTPEREAERRAVVARVVEAMRDDPFIDDARLLGTTQQDQRMDHYASVAVATLSTIRKDG